ncbi:MAG: tetratricopeptide repeat protein [Spirochaetaceae bacterium]|jgi:tetratricopeptide (TPR) repeat protein|nr:tetratricopeptide repeat protein [Spirochaetaceae bacterium]
MKTNTYKAVLCIQALLITAVMALGLGACRSQGAPVPSGTAALLERIGTLLGRGEYDQALDLFNEINPRDAEKSEIKLLKASAYISAGKPGEARSIAEAVLQGDPGHIRAVMVLAEVEASAGRSREEKALLERALKIDPADAAALVSMGNFQVRNNSTRLAAGYYDKALELEPHNGEALIGRAWVYRNSREPKKAEELLNRAVSLYPHWARPIHERGRLYKAAGFPKEALADLDKAKALEPDNYFIACDRGNALIDLGRKSEALAEYERAIAMDSGYFLAYVYSAGIKDELGDYDGAEEAYEKLAQLNPDYYFAFEGLGMHMMRRGDWLAARDAFMEAYRRAKEGEGTYGLLAAMNWMRGGRIQDPRAFLEEVMRKVQRDSLEYWMLRLYHDLVGDADIALRIDREKNTALKSRMLYYLANYYDIRGNKGLADRYFLLVQDLNIKDVPEWRLNQWALKERGLALNQ